MKIRYLRHGSSILAFIGFALLSGVVQAEKELNADEIKKLIVGKTVDAEHLKKDHKFKSYFSEDGKLIMQKNGKIKELGYEISENGEHCVIKSGNTKCAKVVDNGNGTYDRVLVKNGKHVVRWHKFEDGKTF